MCVSVGCEFVSRTKVVWTTCDKINRKVPYKTNFSTYLRLSATVNHVPFSQDRISNLFLCDSYDLHEPILYREPAKNNTAGLTIKSGPFPLIPMSR